MKYEAKLVQKRQKGGRFRPYHVRVKVAEPCMI